MVDIIELSLLFTDPIGDGSVIQTVKTVRSIFWASSNGEINIL